MGFASALDIIEYVRKQLSHYSYTFPKATFVRLVFLRYAFPLIACQSNAPNALVMHLRPYRKDRLICVIRNMYFTGRATSFAKQFQYIFSTSKDRQGETIYKVPMPMVALVATAVRRNIFSCQVFHLFYKLYAALYKWRTGEQQTSEFSANAYLDVYLGHINTLKHIRDKRAGAFHLMMADIYAQAKYVLNQLAYITVLTGLMW